MTFPCENPTPGPAVDMAARISGLVPVVETERFRLRAPVLADFPAFAEIDCSDRARYIGGPETREDAWFSFLGFAAGWMLHGHGGWTITEKSDDAPLGFIILGFEPGDEEVEIGYLLCESAEGRGVATETARAVRDWAEETLNLAGLVSYVDAENTASANVVRRLGATRDPKAEAAFADTSMHVYRHPTPEART